MSTFNAPVHEYDFLVRHVLAREIQLLNYDANLTEDFKLVLESVGTFVDEQLLPLALSADEQGCTIKGNQAFAPEGYKEVYQNYIQDGWGAIHTSVEDGGQGLPLPLSFACDEVLSSGSMAFALYISIRLGVYEVIKTLGSDYLKQKYLEKIGTGVWNGTMCLTEPQCGTDLSLIKTKAVLNEDGTYRLSGTKIFITGGDHHLTENIVHLVLARIEGAPTGLAGLGLFIVPKYLSDNGQIGDSNHVTCARLENKLGIHASATAELVFDQAQGWIVGQPGQGLLGMFSMMKLARIGTSFQALGVAEYTYQKAVDYAQNRIQGRDLINKSKNSIAIIQHPNIRRELLRMQTSISSGRLLAFQTTLLNELTTASDRPELKKLANAILPIFMAVSKTVCSEYGVEVATAAMQTYGGHGYIHESGVEHALRDVQILPIYEGTNDVQSLDIVLRRIFDGKYETVSILLNWLEQQFDELELNECDQIYLEQSKKLFKQLKETTDGIKANLQHNPFAALQYAKDYLWYIAHSMMSVLWLRVISSLTHSENIAVNKQNKYAEAAFYFNYMQIDSLTRHERLKRANEMSAVLQNFQPEL